MEDKNRKDNELFIQATELLRELMRNEHLYEDIAKMQRIINTKNIKKWKRNKRSNWEISCMSNYKNMINKF